MKFMPNLPQMDVLNCVESHSIGRFIMNSIFKVGFKGKFDIIIASLKLRTQTPNEGINQRYLKNWADVADKICFGSKCFY